MQYNDLIRLLELNNIPHRTDSIYDDLNIEYHCIWFSIGHIEFDENDNIDNIVTY